MTIEENEHPKTADNNSFRRTLKIKKTAKSPLNSSEEPLDIYYPNTTNVPGESLVGIPVVENDLESTNATSKFEIATGLKERKVRRINESSSSRKSQDTEQVKQQNVEDSKQSNGIKVTLRQLKQ